MSVRVIRTQFDPRRLGSLALWLDAHDSTSIVLNGTTVSQWSDKSGFGRHATQGTAAAQPSYAATGLLGLPALTVTGTQFLATASFALDDPLTVYAVASINAAASSYRRLIHGGSGAKDQLLFFGALNGNFTTFFGNGSSWNDIAANAPATSVVGASVLAVANGDGIATPYVNGVAQNTKTGTMVAINDGVLICGSFTGGGDAQRWSGAVSEVLVYSASHSRDQVKYITDSLRAKWGVK